MGAHPSRCDSVDDDSSYYYRPALNYSHHKLGRCCDHVNNSSRERSLYIQYINNADDIKKYLYAESGDDIHTKVSTILKVHNYTKFTKDDSNLPSTVNCYKGDDSMPVEGWVSFDHVTLGRDDAESIISGIYNVASRKFSDASGIINVARAIATKARMGNCVGVQVNIREDEGDNESVRSDSVKEFRDSESGRLAFLRYKCW